ncbi:TetR/AcrR family transcriptional regulator [Kribbella sp. NPDC051586]|uniref:TetR/AcrR family transcriptional regulator n=1 Tax=Kribbella sp. NPDC051586 TaxID=3364118 RepID=UPI0037B1D1DC
MTGLRERKKQQTYDALSEAAIALFLKRGFDEVSVTDIAAAANVSKPTLFKYFPTKQDLVLHRIADHRHESARVVAAAVVPPVQALREHFLAGLTARDPITGLNDHPQVLAYYKLVFTTPALTTRLHQFMDDDERALAEAFGAGLAGELLAAQAVSVQRVLSRRNWEVIAAGRRAADRYLDAVTEAETAFDGLPLG